MTFTGNIVHMFYFCLIVTIIGIYTFLLRQPGDNEHLQHKSLHVKIQSCSCWSLGKGSNLLSCQIHVQSPSFRLHLKHTNCHLLLFEPLAGFWEKFEALLRPFCPIYWSLICFQAGVVGFRSGSCVDLPLEEAYGWKRPGFLCELPEERLSSL